MAETKLSTEQKALRDTVARLLWKLESATDEERPDDDEARESLRTTRKEAFKEVRRDYVLKASKLIRLMERQNISLTTTEDA